MAHLDERIKVSSEIAEALVAVCKIHSHDEIIRLHALTDQWEGKGTEPLSGIPLDSLIKILYYGYEVIKTPEDVVLSYIYENRRHYRRTAGTYYRGVTDGATKVAELLGMKIPDEEE